jgi:uncharacterized protein (TIGR00251 family)
MASDLSAVEIVATQSGIELTVKVVPGASQTRVAGAWGSALKVAAAAPPEGGKANAAVLKLLADVFGVRRADVSLASGHSRPVKRIVVAGLTVEAARARLAGSQ